MGERIQLTADDGHVLDAYRADPAGTPKAGMVLIQEIFGVNHHIRSVCDYWAQHGYLVVAPALFDRVGKNIELGYDEAGRNEGMETRGKTTFDENLKDVAAAAEVVQEAGKTVVLGFCFGGAVAWQAACNLDFDVAVCFYGGGIANALDLDANCPVMMHFGEEDAAIPMSDVADIRSAKPDAVIHTYAGAGHGFACDERDSYNAEATALARERTIAFLDEQLG